MLQACSLFVSVEPHATNLLECFSSTVQRMSSDQRGRSAHQMFRRGVLLFAHHLCKQLVLNGCIRGFIQRSSPIRVCFHCVHVSSCTCKLLNVHECVICVCVCESCLWGYWAATSQPSISRGAGQAIMCTQTERMVVLGSFFDARIKMKVRGRVKVTLEKGLKSPGWMCSGSINYLCICGKSTFWCCFSCDDLTEN